MKNDVNLHIRISKDDLLLLDYVASCCGMNRSEYLRMMIDTAITPTQRKIRNKEVTYEDIKTIFYDKLQQRRFFTRQTRYHD